MHWSFHICKIRSKALALPIVKAVQLQCFNIIIIIIFFPETALIDGVVLYTLELYTSEYIQLEI